MSQVSLIETYKVWLSKYKSEKDTTLFISLNQDEALGIKKVYYLIKPLLPNDFIFILNRVSPNVFMSSRNRTYLRNILPYNNNLPYYRSLIKEFDSLIHLILEIRFSDKLSKSYILILSNVNQLNGCIFGMQLFDVDDSIDIVTIGRGDEKIKLPKVTLSKRMLK